MVRPGVLSGELAAWVHCHARRFKAEMPSVNSIADAIKAAKSSKSGAARRPIFITRLLLSQPSFIFKHVETNAKHKGNPVSFCLLLLTQIRRSNTDRAFWALGFFWSVYLQQIINMVCAKCQRQMKKTELATPGVKNKKEMYYGSPATLTAGSTGKSKTSATLGPTSVGKVILFFLSRIWFQVLSYAVSRVSY